MDSSSPVLVSRLPDRRALARLVRAALRHEVVLVPLTQGPRRPDAHTLDVHVAGQPNIALIAEPAGVGKNGQFPLRLRPLHRAQAAQLYALVEAENIPLDGPPDASPIATGADAVDHTLALPSAELQGRSSTMPGPNNAPVLDSTPLTRGMSGGTSPLAQQPSPTPPPTGNLGKTLPLGAKTDDVRRSQAPPSWNGDSDPRKTAPSAAWKGPPPTATGPRPSVPADPPSRSAPIDDPRKTAPSAVWANLVNPRAEAPAQAHGALADDRSLTMNVDLEDVELLEEDVEVAPEPARPLSAALAADNAPHTRAGLGDPQAAPAGATESARGDQPPPNTEPPSNGPATINDPVEARATHAEPASAGRDDEGFFDDALANLPVLSDVDDEGLVAVPPPPDDNRVDDDDEVVDLSDGEVGDDEATLVRVPASTRQVDKPPSEDTKAKPARKPSTRRKSKSKSEDTGTFPDAVLPTSASETQPRSVPGDGEHPPVTEEPILGRRIADGKYVIESHIGSGATGAVYRATHRELRRTVAIKILHPHYQRDPQFMSDFRDEALAASQLDHPNVMRVLDFDQEPDGLIYIVMEFLSGRTLQSLLDEERRLPAERAVEIMIQVCAALSVAHDHGIIHRDIKPDNIMLVPSRNDEGTTFELVKVCDFGIAALQNRRPEDTNASAVENVIAGTPEYMSPEQARGAPVDARSDVYACGVCLYELVTGRPPFLGEPVEVLTKQLTEVPKPPSHLVKGLDPIVEEVILRAIQKAPTKRHQSAREMRVELKELIELDDDSPADRDERSLVENVPVLDDPASGFTGFFIAFASAILRMGRFERGHDESAQATKELSKSLRAALRGRSELTFARRDIQQSVAYAVMTGTAEIADLRRLIGSQLYGSFGQAFIEKLVTKGVGALTLREGVSEAELHTLIELMLGGLADDELRQELLSKSLRNVSALFLTDIIGRERSLQWKVGLGASRLIRDLRALCNVRGLSLKKMRETRDELVGGVARLLTRGSEVKQFIFHADLVDDAVANLRGFSSFHVAPLIIERVLHEPCAEAAMVLLNDYEAAGGADQERIRALLPLFAERLVTERSPKSDAAVAELYRRKIITDDNVPRDLKETIQAHTLADGIAREPSQFLMTLDLIGDPESYAEELTTLEPAMAALARRGEAIALLAVMTTLARHAKGSGKAGPRETAALRTMKSMLDQQRLLPVAKTVLVGPANQRDAARQLILLAGSIGTSALYAARETTPEPAARPVFVAVLREAGAAGWALLAQVLPGLELRDDAELALVEDLLRALPERPDPVLGEAVARFLAHPVLRPTALAALVPLWGERAKKPLVEALEYADEPTRVIALTELRRLRVIDEQVVTVIERFLTMRGSAGDELRAAAAAALADVPQALRTRAVQLLSRSIEGKRGLVALLRGNEGDEGVVVMEAMARALLSLDRAEGLRAIRARVSRSDGIMKQRLSSLLHHP